MNEDKSVEQRLQIADEAGRMLESTLFNAVITSLLKNYMEKLVSAEPGSQEAVGIHMRIKSLDEIKGELRALHNDAAVLRKRLQNK